MIPSLTWAFDKPSFLTGKLGLQQYSPRSLVTQGQGSSIQSSGYLWLKLNPEITSDFNFKSNILTTLFYNSVELKKDFDLKADPREAYLQYSPTASTEIKLGKFVETWGKADLVNPTDFLTARDLRFFSEDSELRRLGGYGALMRFTPNEGLSPFQWSAVFFATGPVNQQLIPDGFSINGITLQIEPQGYFVASRNFEGAIKGQYTQSNWDASFSFFRGRDRFSEFVYNTVTSRIDLLNPRVSALGVDASVSFQTWVLKFEGAYYDSEFGALGMQGAALTQPNHFDLVVGAERAFWTDFRVLAQVLLRHHTQWVDPKNTYQNINPITQNLVRAVSEKNAILKNYHRRTRPAVSLTLIYENENSQLGFDVSAIGNFLGGDTVYRPKVSYKAFENAKIHLGAEVYSGSRNETFGILKDFSNIFAEAQYLF